jgi:hypothetical protein
MLASKIGRPNTVCNKCKFTYCIWCMHFHSNQQHIDIMLGDLTHCRKHSLHISWENKGHHRFLSQGCSICCLDTDHQTHILDVHLLKQKRFKAGIIAQDMLLVLPSSDVKNTALWKTKTGGNQYKVTDPDSQSRSVPTKHVLIFS